MRPLWYKLEGHKPIPCSAEDANYWLVGLQDARTVARTDIGKVRISTVFLCLDHSHSMSGPPILFETMIFGGKHNDYQRRYATWEQAETGHAEAVALVEAEEEAMK